MIPATMRWLPALAVALAISACAGGAGIAPVRGPAVASSAARTSANPGGEADGDVPGACGKERWAVKTGSDDAAGRVAVGSPADTTIAALRALPAPSEADLNSHPTDRIAPVELTVYRLQATLVEYKRETDSDYHLVIAGPQGETMIAEIPAPSCVFGGPLRGSIAGARAAFDARFPGAERQLSFAAYGGPVTLAGVGFFDFQHGQSGVAPNAIELHPVLAIAFGAGGRSA